MIQTFNYVAEQYGLKGLKIKTMKNLTTTQNEYLEYLLNIRNDFYNKGLSELAKEVEEDIEELIKKSKK